MKEEKFRVTGMSCAACSTRVEKAVTKLDGTDEVSVNLLTGTMFRSYRRLRCKSYTRRYRRMN